MATVLRLTVMTGPHKGEKFCFCGPARSLIGRAPDCFVQLVGTLRDDYISRHHCELVVEPSRLTITDLTSQNGTYLNGARIESLELALNSRENRDSVVPGPTLNQGDMLTVGGTTFQVDLVECPPNGNVPTEVPLWETGQGAKKGCPIRCI